MIHCKVCHAWRPSKWEGWRWVDTEAPCIYVEGHNMFAEGTCERASIVKPKETVHGPTKTVTKSKAKTKVREIIREQAPVNRDNRTKREYYPHQREAIERFRDSSEAALFFEMGTGKSATVLAIVAAQFRAKKLDALLVIAPNDVHRQWAIEQIPEWLHVPFDIQCLFGRGGAKEAYPFDENPDVLQVVCVNIDTFSTPAKWQDIVNWANSRKTFIILDEATVIKNVSAKRTQRVLYEFNTVVHKGKQILSSKVKSVGRAVLTGTPVTNGPFDLWAIMEFLRPNYFGRNWYSFQAHFGMFTKLDVNGRAISIPLNEDTWTAIKGINSYGEAYAIFGCSEDTFNTIHAQAAYEGPYKHADELKQLIAPVSMFKQLKECTELPAQLYNQRLIRMSPEQQACYDSMCAELLAEYRGHTATALNKMTAIVRLQQISSGFIFDKDFDIKVDGYSDEGDIVARLYSLVEERDITPDDRIQWIGASNPKLDALYRDIDESVKPVIVVTRFSAEAARIFGDLSARMSCCLMTGWKRVGTIEEFKDGKYQVMVANGNVLKFGFNLQNSHSIMFYSNTFSLETRLQTEGRIFRLGQTETCLYTDYLNVDSVDEKIVSALKLKRNLLDYIRTAEIEEVVK
jgi:SNF2 family DNA or RNA helicase